METNCSNRAQPTQPAQFSEREPAFDAYPEFNNNHARIQQLLREGISQTDLGILYLKYGEPMPYNDVEATWLLDHVRYIWFAYGLSSATLIPFAEDVIR